MSYNLTLPCGCLVYVACHPETRLAHTRVVERRGGACPVARHDVGARIYLWEMLPEPARNTDLTPLTPRRNQSSGTVYSGAWQNGASSSLKTNKTSQG